MYVYPLSRIQSPHSNMSDHSYSLFGLICSPHLSEQRANLLLDKTRELADWSSLPLMAARHQVGPLFYWHLKSYGIAYPQEVRRAVAGMYARQKAVAAAQAETLAEIIRALNGSGVESVVIKGGAVAHIIYSEAGLRPKEDLDILVRPEHASSAHAVLLELGFHAPLPSSRYDFLQHHLPLAQRTRDNITVNVELHTSAFNLLMQDKLSMANVQRPLQPYMVLGQTMQTLNPLQMMWMQYLGMRKLAEPLRYIHLADLAGMAEHFVDAFDWLRLRQDYPDLWNAFEAIHAFSPLNRAACERLELRQSGRSLMANIGDDFQGWPRVGFAGKSRRDQMHLMRSSFCPPDWWSRLVYGVRTDHSRASILIYHHPSAFFQQGIRRLYLGPVSSQGFFKGSV
jgi:hypothetical protein